MKFGEKLQHAWNAFSGRNTSFLGPMQENLGVGYFTDPTRFRFFGGSERTIVTSIYNRIGIDVAALSFRHARVDRNGAFMSTIDSNLNQRLSLTANIDQTGRALIQDIVMSLCEEGAVAVVPVDTDVNPDTGAFKINSLRTGKITEWFPEWVRVELYNEQTGQNEEIYCRKDETAIIENPLYAVMNASNSTLRRLIRKLSLMDTIDEQNGSGKLDLIIQLPYVIKTESRRQQAEKRRKDIEMQLAGSKYGIAYTDGTEHITQLNRSVENNLLAQAEYYMKMLFNQLGLAESIFDGTADEATMLNYNNRTIEPIASAITDEFTRKFLTKTARTQGQAVVSIRNPFKLVPVSEMAEIADKFTRNEILSPNEVRSIIGYYPSEDPKANELRNRNLNQDSNAEPSPVPGGMEETANNKEGAIN